MPKAEARSLMVSVPSPVPGGRPQVMPRRFYDRVTSHVCQSTVFTERRPPMVLGVIGKPGMGKTENVERACRRNGWAFHWIAGSDLAGFQQGAPIEKFKQGLYAALVKKRDQSAEAAVLLIDDFDLTIMNTKADRWYTEHTQLLTSQFMSYCDKPVEYLQSTEPVSIVVTLNTIDGFHSPLIREGRMRLWQWVPTADETMAMARERLSELDERVADRVIETFRAEPIAFFAHLENEIFASAVELVIGDRDVQGQGIIPDLRVKKASFGTWMNSLKSEWVVEVGQRVRAERQSRQG